MPSVAQVVNVHNYDDDKNVFHSTQNIREITLLRRNYNSTQNTGSLRNITCSLMVENSKSHAICTGNAMNSRWNTMVLRRLQSLDQDSRRNRKLAWVKRHLFMFISPNWQKHDYWPDVSFELTKLDKENNVHPQEYFILQASRLLNFTTYIQKSRIKQQYSKRFTEATQRFYTQCNTWATERMKVWDSTPQDERCKYILNYTTGKF